MHVNHLERIRDEMIEYRNELLSKLNRRKVDHVLHLLDADIHRRHGRNTVYGVDVTERVGD